MILNSRKYSTVIKDVKGLPMKSVAAFNLITYNKSTLRVQCVPYHYTGCNTLQIHCDGMAARSYMETN